MNNRKGDRSIIIIACILLSLIPSSLVLTSPVAVSPPSVFGNTWIVDQSGGGDFTSIQDAIDVSSNGDQIIINDGAYNEILTIDKSIRINGNNINNTIIKGSDVGNGITIIVNDVQISNITITNFEKGIYSQDHQYLNISYTKISYCTDGISFVKCNNNIIEYSIICNYYGIGMSLDECSNNDVTNCRLYNGTGSGILFSGLKRSFKNNVIKNNYINNTYGGVGTNGDETTISNNTIHDTYYGIGVMFGHNNIIFNNTIMKVRDGISYSSTASIFHNISIKNCYYGIYSTSGNREFRTHFDHITIENASSNGVFLEGSQHNITNSKIKNCTNNGIYINGHSNCLIENVTIEDAKIGIDLHNGYKYRFKNNKIKSCDTGISLSEERNRDNTVIGNEIKNCDIGMNIRYTMTTNRIFGNEFIDNLEDVQTNVDSIWYENYPYGGNYWSKYIGEDVLKGEQQDQYGSDGIGDTPYYPTPTQLDRYPLFKDMIKPVANAGGDRSIDLGSVAHFDTSLCTDDQLIHKALWSWQYGDERVEIEQLDFDYRFEIPGEFTIYLNVFDFAGNRDTDEMVLTVLDMSPPIAVIENITIDQGGVARFDGSQCTDNGIIESYKWTFTYDGTERTLEGEIIEFKFDIPGYYDVTLVVEDSMGNTGWGYLTVTVRDTEDPTAVAGEDIEIENGDTAYFDGSDSSDNGVVISYNWTFKYQGEDRTLKGENADFKFDTPGTFKVTLTVKDQFDNEGSDTLKVRVIDTIPPVPKISGSTEYKPDEKVELDASGSTDNHRIKRYRWTFNDPDYIEVPGPILSRQFDRVGKHNITLTVWDPTGLNASLSVTINIWDTTSPVADAGPDLTVPVGSEVVLDGSGSTDDGSIIQYKWIFKVEGEDVVLEGVRTNYTFEKGGEYSILLAIRDDGGNIGEDFCTITVVDYGWFAGTVTDENGDPIEGAVVTIIPGDGSGEIRFTTTANGSFRMEVPMGSFTWKIEAGGYETITGSGEIEPMETVELESSGSVMVRTEDGESSLFIWIIIAALILLLICGIAAFLFLRSGKKGGDREGGSPEEENAGNDEPPLIAGQSAEGSRYEPSPNSNMDHYQSGWDPGRSYETLK